MEKTYTVYYEWLIFSNRTDYHTITFKSKDNADAFIALMKSEGIGITDFGGLGYTGE